jgi:hypothetical protein
MRSSFRRSTLNSPSWPDSRGGARRHPHSDIKVDGKAAERLHDVLRTLQNEVRSAERTGTRLTHTNSSPTNPGWFRGCFELVEKVAFTTTRDNTSFVPIQNAAEVYLMNPNGSDPQRITENEVGDGFPVLSPDGEIILFDSNRLRTETEHISTSDLFVMASDGTEQTHLARGSSASWAPDSKSPQGQPAWRCESGVFAGQQSCLPAFVSAADAPRVRLGWLRNDRHDAMVQAD